MAFLVVMPMVAVLVVVAGAGAQDAPTSTECGAAGTAQSIGSVRLDAEQLGNAQTIVAVTAGRALPVFAAVVAVTTAYTESDLHNSPVQSDHNSEGLFQQRVSVYTAAVAIDPVKATNAFLDRLIAVPGWQANPVGVDAQTVQISAYPQRYQPNAALAQQLVGQFWPAALTTTVADSAPICPGGGGTGGNNTAGTTSIPAGLVITGSPHAQTAIRFALAQLGKPYVFGAAGPAAFDCSGLSMAAWAAAGIALPHLASAQAGDGTAEPDDLSTAVGGDLVFIPGSDGTAAEPGHVAILAGYITEPDGRHPVAVQAAQTGVPIEVSDLDSWAGQIVAVRHIA